MSTDTMQKRVKVESLEQVSEYEKLLELAADELLELAERINNSSAEQPIMNLADYDSALFELEQEYVNDPDITPGQQMMLYSLFRASQAIRRQAELSEHNASNKNPSTRGYHEKKHSTYLPSEPFDRVDFKYRLAGWQYDASFFLLDLIQQELKKQKGPGPDLERFATKFWVEVQQQMEESLEATNQLLRNHPFPKEKQRAILTGDARKMKSGVLATIAAAIATEQSGLKLNVHNTPREDFLKQDTEHAIDLLALKKKQAASLQIKGDARFLEQSMRSPLSNKTASGFPQLVWILDDTRHARRLPDKYKDLFPDLVKARKELEKYDWDSTAAALVIIPTNAEVMNQSTGILKKPVAQALAEQLKEI